MSSERGRSFERHTAFLKINFVEMGIWLPVILVQSRNDSRLKQHKTTQINMKYAILFHEKTEHFARRSEPGFMDAGWLTSRRSDGRNLFNRRGLLPPESATMVSVRDGKRQVHDGPYAETKEFLGGFVIIDVPDLDAALEWAARHPAAAIRRSKCVRC